MPKIIVGELKLGESLQEHVVSDSSSVRICDDSRRTAYVIRLMPDGKTLEITAGEPFADATGNICGRTLAVVPAESTRIFVRAEKYGEDGRGSGGTWEMAAGGGVPKYRGAVLAGRKPRSRLVPAVENGQHCVKREWPDFDVDGEGE
jgi:hypothetical protein